jgi:hypothetical protein
MSDLFFKLPRTKAKKVISEAMKLSNSVYVEELDCRKSFSRVPTILTATEIFSKGLKEKNTLWHYVIRSRNFGPETDIGLSTMPTNNDPTYFLWINMDTKMAFDLAKKYKLKRMN